MECGRGGPPASAQHPIAAPPHHLIAPPLHLSIAPLSASLPRPAALRPAVRPSRGGGEHETAEGWNAGALEW